MFSDDDVGAIYHGHEQQVELEIPELRCFEAAYEGKFWRSRHNPWVTLVEGDDGLPVKVEVNRVWPFVSAQVSNLFFRKPTTEARAPTIGDVKRGRPKKLEGLPERIEALCDEWLRRADVQVLATLGYQMGLMYGASAFKLGMLPKGRGSTLLHRLWLDVLPRWECVWDDRARTPQQQSYRGHVRWELDTHVEELLGESLPDGVQRYALPDRFVSEELARTPDEGHRVERYVKLLEFYDLQAEEQRFYIADPGRSKRVMRVGDVAPIPYTMPSGAPGMPMHPIVLSNVPRYPLRAVPAVRRIYQTNAEINLLMTIVANGVRRDSGRMVAYLREKCGDDFVEALKAGRDMTYVPFEGETLDGLWKVMELPEFAQTLPMYTGFLEKMYADAQGFADVLAGKQLKYATAREVDVVAGAGESTVTEIGSRMQEALARTVELMLVVVATEMDGPIDVRRGKEIGKITREELELPWTIEITDAASTPLRLEKRRQDWGTALGLLTTLIERATLNAKQPDGTDAVSKESRKFAQLGVDYTVDLYELPDSMTWAALSLAEEETMEEEPDREQIKELLAERLGENGAPAAAPVPGPPAGPLGVA